MFYGDILEPYVCLPQDNVVDGVHVRDGGGPALVVEPNSYCIEIVRVQPGIQRTKKKYDKKIIK